MSCVAQLVQTRNAGEWGRGAWSGPPGLRGSPSEGLTVAFFSEGETEAQGNARVYCMWVAPTTKLRQEAKAGRPAP